MPVGESERSRFKHHLLEKIVGKTTGVASRLDVTNTVFIDACAGDGLPNSFSGISSPAIFAKNIRYLATAGKKPVHGYFIESSRATFNQLKFSLQRIEDSLGFPDLLDHVSLLKADYRAAETAALLTELTSNSVCFLYVDPNHVNDVELSKELLGQLPALTTFFVTLGCNVGGLKRAVPEERQAWFDRIKAILEGLVAPRHDACLVWLEGDPSQWAYLLSVVNTWRPTTEIILRVLRKQWSIGWIWQSDQNFLPALQERFMTNDELKEQFDNLYQSKLFPDV
jgi:hypothetical protein